MIDGRLYNIFGQWLNHDESTEFLPLEKRGLKENAPESAKKAYGEFLALVENARNVNKKC